MRAVRVPAEKLREIRGHLEKTASLEKRASELELENDVLRRTMGLVADGVLDPAVAMDKVASFLEDSDSLRVLELAVSLDTSSIKLGSVVEDDITAPRGSESPEDRLRSDVEDIVADTGLSVF